MVESREPGVDTTGERRMTIRAINGTQYKAKPAAV